MLGNRIIFQKSVTYKRTQHNCVQDYNKVLGHQNKFKKNRVIFGNLVKCAILWLKIKTRLENASVVWCIKSLLSF